MGADLLCFADMFWLLVVVLLLFSVDLSIFRNFDFPLRFRRERVLGKQRRVRQQAQMHQLGWQHEMCRLPGWVVKRWRQEMQRFVLAGYGM